MPAYNAEKQFCKSIDSILAQTYKDIEVLIIDDGSKDSTGEIADRYAEKDHRVRVIHVQNGGESKARNLGILNSVGEYIAFCDADDYMHPDMLEKMYSAIVKDDTEIAICSWRNIDSDGNIMNWRVPNMKSGVLSSKEVQKQFLLTINIEGFCWNKLIKKELYERGHIRYDDRRYSFCDIVANYRLLKKTSRVSYIEEQLYDYIQLDTSCVHTLNLRKDIDYMDTLKEIYGEATQEGYQKQAQVYVVNRIQKYLYEMYKNRNQYEEKFINEYFKKAYRVFLQCPFFVKIYYAFWFPIENPVKFIVKICIVRNYYRKMIK